ncbi:MULTISPECIES: heme uptake protein IsdC [Bacillaceae]|uniref:heme uptake protein IsdC n=1 Tax=Bacillaceae TaxID=186817 RepID=UPI001E4E8DD3|nr:MULTISPECIES: heme uptake protein IsdC [Bacillaceae]MCE4050559.1 heme uptake protein IsdC [Bacillus sp. Au-Bac7]MCM3034226.1 heme uptake protein IsdC [Niallia sp. MER 6]MDL0434496.1 heme uptake protein IsdC [Niallia sp. SS-2023]UPO88533.1 heme uptake protein IsdC [Niallia sp. Man26]
MLKQKVAIKIVAILAIFTFLSVGFSTKSLAASLADGEYSINYSVLRADNDSASMADGYFQKPAKLIVENGALKVQVGISTSAITEFKVGGQNVTEISKNGESSVVQFNINSLQNPTNAEIHVIVEDQNYDHWYTIRFDFDESSANALSSQSNSSTSETSNSTSETAASSTEQDTTKETAAKVENPRTSDQSEITVFTVLMVVSLGIIVFYVVNRKKLVK